MKLTIERATLLKALGHVQSVVERRNTIPILSNVLLSADQGRLAFCATDLDMEIADASPARIEAPGQVTAPAHTLFEIVRRTSRRRGRVPELQRRGSPAGDPGRPFALPPAGAARWRLSGNGVGGPIRADRHRHRRSDPADRQDPLRHLHRGDALLPQRPLSACGGRRWGPAAACGGHRWPAAWPWPRPGRRRDWPARPASSFRARPSSRRAGCWTTLARPPRSASPTARSASASARRR